MRVCYDHLAGEVAVRFFERLLAEGLLEGSDDTLGLTPRGEAWCAELGIDLAGARTTRRKLCRPCLDWSERRMHLAGALGAALFDGMIRWRYLRRDTRSRGVTILPRGEMFLERLKRV